MKYFWTSILQFFVMLHVQIAADPIHGDASYTDLSLSGGTCSFTDYKLPDGILGTGLGPSNWAGSGKCGACLQVVGPEGSVKVMVIDSCPNCPENRLNMGADAFSRIADLSEGVVDVTYDPVGILRPALVNDVAEQGGFSMLVLNCNYHITALDVSTDNGQTWQPTVRQDYNYFEKDGKKGFEKSAVTVRIICSNGKQVIVPNVSTADKAQTVVPANC